MRKGVSLSSTPELPSPSPHDPSPSWVDSDPLPPEDSDSSYSSNSSAPVSLSCPSRIMPAHNAAKCIHDEPKKIPLLMAGEVSLLVMHQWEMACEDFFSTSKKLDVADCVST